MLLTKSDDLLVRLMGSRLLYFSGGGTTDLKAVKNDSCVENLPNVDFARSQMVHSLWCSFGLSAAVKKQRNKGSDFSKVGNLAIPEAIKDRHKSIIQDDGFIDFSRVFCSLWDDSYNVFTDESESKVRPQSRPIYLELGSGSGDWIVNQASANPAADYVAVELRADRVAQTFSKVALNAQGSSPDDKFFVPLFNVCCVGSECGSFLRHRVKDNLISKIFVNHPEPPTQTFGAEEEFTARAIETEEPAHMLNSCTLFYAAQCLKPDGEGKLIIVTDNLWYARVICLTLIKVLTRDPEILEKMDLEGEDSPKLLQIFNVPGGEGKVGLYVGQPCEAIGILNSEKARNFRESGSSYFDRLWRAGGGKHAHKTDRYIIAMQTCHKTKKDVGGACSVSTGRLFDQELSSNNENNQNKRKRSKKGRNPEKQALRNQRRLGKKKIEKK